MPNIGDIKLAPELGYRGHALYRFSICQSCGKERWVRLRDYEQGKGAVCRSCGYPSSNFHQKRLAHLIASGAKRASELGKPVFKKRDPWYYPRLCSSCGKLVWQQSKDFHRVCKECAYIVRNTARGEKHPNWSGGRYNHGDGYIVVAVPSDSPYRKMADSKGYVLEHRLLMAQYLGRCLLDGEVVHHIDGDKKNNAVGNLELLPNDASHLPYILLQQKVARLEQEVQLLKWHIRELEQANPEVAGASASGNCRDFTGGVLDSKDEEKVHPHKKL